MHFLHDIPHARFLPVPSPNAEKNIDVVIEEKILTVTTAAGSPKRFSDKLKGAGIYLLHVVSTCDLALKMLDAGVDAVIAGGSESGGFMGSENTLFFNMNRSFSFGVTVDHKFMKGEISLKWDNRLTELLGCKYPIMQGALTGVGTWEFAAACSHAGADGVYIGSAITATHECAISERVKQNMILAQPDEPYRIRELTAPPDPEAYAELMAKRDSMDLNKWIRAVEATFLKLKDKKKTTGEKTIWEEGAEGLGEDPYAEGSTKGPFSFSCAYIHHIVSVKDFIENMVKEAEEILQAFARRHQLIS